MTQAYRMIVRQHGGPDVIEREDMDTPVLAHGQVLVATEAIGLNYIDTYFRTGLYPGDLPLTLGHEGAGRVAAVGPGVTAFSVGDRVASGTGKGSYTTHWVVSQDQLVALPDSIDSTDAAAMMLKGMTACYLAEDVLPLKAGQVALVHAAAGGVGSVLVPWLRDKGVIVIAHSGSAQKAAKVDADHSLHDPMETLADHICAITDGHGVDVVYDGVGKASWNASIASLKRRGMMVSYGNASGAVPPVNLLDLSRGGSLYVTRPTLFDYVATPEALTHTAQRLFDRMAQGIIKAEIGQHFALTDAAQAHRMLEARQTVGSTVLAP